MAVGGKEDLRARQHSRWEGQNISEQGVQPPTPPHHAEQDMESAPAADGKVPEHPQKHHHSKTPSPQVLIEPATDPESRKDQDKNEFLYWHSHKSVKNKNI